MSEIVSRKLRASQVPLFLTCGRSIVRKQGDPEIDFVGEVAAIGTAFHEVMQARVELDQAGDFDPISHEVIESIARDGHLTPDQIEELADLVEKGEKIWRRFAHRFPEPVTEEKIAAEFRGIGLTGHPDLYSQTLNLITNRYTIEILDWKAGWVDRDYSPQVKAYSLLLALAAGGADRIERVNVLVAFVRAGRVHEWSYAPDELESFAVEIHDAVESAKEAKYSAGEHCTYCPRYYGCPARKQITREVISSLQSGNYDGSTLREMGPSLKQMRVAVSIASKALDDFKAILKQELEAGGPIDLGDCLLSLSERQTRSIEPRKAWPVLQEYLSEDGLAGSVKVSLTKALDTAAAEYVKEHGNERGAKTKVKSQLEVALRAAGAIETSPYKTIVETAKEMDT